MDVKVLNIEEELKYFSYFLTQSMVGNRRGRKGDSRMDYPQAKTQRMTTGSIVISWLSGILRLV